MKYRNYLKNFLLLAIVSTLFFSCEDDDDTVEPSTPEATYFMKATIDGKLTNYPKCDLDTFGYFGNGAIDLSGYYNYFALTPLIKTSIDFDVYDLDFILKKDTSYSLDGNSPFYATYVSDFNSLDDTSLYYSTNGQIRFSKIGPDVFEGTFSFNALRSDSTRNISVSNGSFSAKMKKQ